MGAQPEYRFYAHHSTLSMVLGMCFGGIIAGMGLAQQTSDTGGVQVDLTYSERLLHDDDETSLRSDIGLDVSSETRRERFAFGLSAGIEKFGSDGFDARLEDPRASLGYRLEARDSVLSFNSSYGRTDVDGLLLQQTEFLDFVTLVDDPGTREDFTAGATLEIARRARFGATISSGYSQTNYLETESTSIVDSELLTGSTQLRFTLSQTATAFLTLSFSDLNRDGGLDVRKISLGSSMDVEISPELRATFDLGITRLRRSGSISNSTSRGLFYGTSLTADRPNGTFSAIVDSTIEENGRRSALQVNRTLELPLGSLSAGIGLRRNSNISGIDPLYNLKYTHNLPRMPINVDFSQFVATNSVGLDTLNSILSLSTDMQLNAVSSLGVAFNNNNQSTSGGTDANQMSFSVDYAFTLNSNWTFIAGFSHSRDRQDGSAKDTEEQIYLGMRTELGWRP